MRRPVFSISDHVRHKPECTVTKARQVLEILIFKTREIVLSGKQNTIGADQPAQQLCFSHMQKAC